MKKKTKKNINSKFKNLNLSLLKSFTNKTKKKFENYISDYQKKELKIKLIMRKD